jgi:polar amino acid transport system substrate-binding protein
VSRVTRQRRAITGTLASLAVAAVLAGCATTATEGTAASSRTTGHTSTTKATQKSAAGATTASCNPYESLAPQSGGPNVTSGSWAATIRARGYLIAGVDQTTYHFGYLNPLTGQIEGFDIDMIKDVAAAIFGLSPDSPALAQHIHFKSIDDAERITDIQNGTVDIVAHTMTVNCSRMQEVDFSSIYYDAKQRVLVDTLASGATAPDLAQLGAAHEKVCATSGSDSVAQIQAAHAVPVQVRLPGAAGRGTGRRGLHRRLHPLRDAGPGPQHRRYRARAGGRAIRAGDLQGPPGLRPVRQRRPGRQPRQRHLG